MAKTEKCKGLTWTNAIFQTKWFTEAVPITITLNIDTFSWCTFNNLLIIITGGRITRCIFSVMAATCSVTESFSSHSIYCTRTWINPFCPWESIRTLFLKNNVNVELWILAYWVVQRILRSDSYIWTFLTNLNDDFQCYDYLSRLNIFYDISWFAAGWGLRHQKYQTQSRMASELEYLHRLCNVTSLSRTKIRINALARPQMTSTSNITTSQNILLFEMSEHLNKSYFFSKILLIQLCF